MKCKKKKILINILKIMSSFFPRGEKMNYQKPQQKFLRLNKQFGYISGKDESIKDFHTGYQ